MYNYYIRFLSDFWLYISSAVAPGRFLILTLKDWFDKPCWSMPFKIESSIIVTTFLFTVFRYLWLWSKFFNSFVLSQISLLWFSFIQCSCGMINEFLSGDAWSVFLYDISLLVQLSVVFVGFVGTVSWSIICFFQNYCIRCICGSSVLFVWQYLYYFWFHFTFLSE